MRITVVVPVKDDAPMLERCLESLEQQVRKPDEIVVVDNGSSDSTAEVGRRFGARVIPENRPGITAAASRGYDAASGDVIARCDADSRLPSDWLARIEHTLDERPDAVGVTGGARFYDLSPVAGWLARALYLGAYFATVSAATAHIPLFGSNFALRRPAWQAVSDTVPRDEPDLHDDFDLSYRLSPRDRILFDWALTVSISGRPFRDGRAFRRRVRRAGATLRAHMPEQLPHRRWRRRLLGE